MKSAQPWFRPVALVSLSVAVFYPSLARAALHQCAWVSTNNKLYYVVAATSPVVPEEFGTQVTSLIMTGGTAQGLAEWGSGESVVTAASGASTLDVLNISGTDISAIKRTAVVSGFTAGIACD